MTTLTPDLARNLSEDQALELDIPVYPFPSESIKKPKQKIKAKNKDHANQMKIELTLSQKFPLFFVSHFCWIKSKGISQYKPYEYQKRFIKEIENNQNVVALCGRQMGKTETAAMYLLWFAMFNSYQTVLITANKMDQAREIMERIQFAYSNCPDHIRAGAIDHNKSEISFDNGSKIVCRATTADAGRGLSPTFVYSDELAFLKTPRLQQEFYSAITPTLSTTQGKFVITSTPNNEHDLFSGIWRGANRFVDNDGNELDPNGPGANGFRPIKATWIEHPDRDEEWERKERNKMDDDVKFEREHNCEFVGESTTLIDNFVLKNVMNDVQGNRPVLTHAQVKWYEKPQSKYTYIVSMDLSGGVGGDFAALGIFRLPGMVQVGEWMSNRVDTSGQVRVLRSVLQTLKEEIQHEEIYWSFENNNHGEAFTMYFNEMGLDEFPGQMISEKKKKRNHEGKRRKGFTTTNLSKNAACARLKNLVEKGKLIIKSPELARQLSFFVARGASYEAKLGEHDDLVSSTLIAVRVLERVMVFEDQFAEEFQETADDDHEPPPAFIVM